MWESSDDNLLRLFFGRKLYFWRQLDIELTKLSNPRIYEDEENVQCGIRKLEDLSLFEIGKINPELEKNLQDAVFEKSKDTDRKFTCACCGKSGTDRISFQVDHIKPMNRGGKAVLENLQLLCRQCNGMKGDKID